MKCENCGGEDFYQSSDIPWTREQTKPDHILQCAVCGARYYEWIRPRKDEGVPVRAVILTHAYDRLMATTSTEVIPAHILGPAQH